MDSACLGQFTKALVILEFGKYVTENFAAIPNASALRNPTPIFGEGLVKYMYEEVFQGNISK